MSMGEVTREKTRIYVGGLGGAVTADDLRKTFSALGEVVSVDVVRTKGRSFAYLDFLPSSDKSLPKLFSTYNGCMWKGGKLRLEKAKEHYLLRLRHEWQEDSEHASKASNSCNAHPSENHHTLEKPKKPSSADKTQLGQLRIFFPKLQKVKSLASVGFGKHKYSFQRVQVPSIPTHFCDCEEHERPFLTTNKKQSSEFEDASSGINEQELNIMNSVMNKIFERENPSKQVNERGIFMKKSDDEFLAIENVEEDHLTDEDNLIINVGTGKSDSMDLLGEMTSMMANQEPASNRLRSCSVKPNNVQDSRKKKRKPPHSEEKDGNNTVIPETTRSSQIHLNTREDGKKVESGTKQLGSNSLRSLKSTWKDLIGQKANSPFSISNIISTVAQEKNVENTPKKKKRKLNTKENECEQKGEDPRIELDIHPSACEQKEEERRTDDDLDMPITTISQQFSKSDVLPSASEQKEDDLENNKSLDKHEKADIQTGNSKYLEKHNEDLIRTARGESWRHKSSWTQLISNTGNTAFSISQVVPNLSFKQVDSLDLEPENKNLIDESPAALVTEQQMFSEKKTSERKIILSLGNLESDETCPFMRTQESVKEWNKAKASLNKKKRSLEESA